MSSSARRARSAAPPLIERPTSPPAQPRQFLRDLAPVYGVNAVIGVVFGITGPVAITMTVGIAGGLTDAQLASWVCGMFFSAGAATLVMSIMYRRPLGFAWSIPGTVLLGPSLQDLSFAEVVGAFFTSGVLILALGFSGVVRKVMSAIPLPLVMAMVAAIFLRFGLDIVDSSRTDPSVVVPMLITFVVLSASRRLSRVVPPILGALAVGLLAVLSAGRFNLEHSGRVLAAPVFTAPHFTWAAQLELVVPLVLTVLVVQNGQGAAVLRNAGHEAPVNASAVASGAMSVVNACFGAVSACLTGPTNALLTGSGERDRQYTGAIVYAVLCFAAAAFAPLITRFMLGTPEAFILALGGIAMLAALRQAFVSAFSARFTLGALVTFLVTVAEFDPLNIHAAFWGILIGYGVSRLLEREDHREAAEA